MNFDQLPDATALNIENSVPFIYEFVRNLNPQNKFFYLYLNLKSMHLHCSSVIYKHCVYSHQAYAMNVFAIFTKAMHKKNFVVVIIVLFRWRFNLGHVPIPFVPSIVSEVVIGVCASEIHTSINRHSETCKLYRDLFANM